jgi:hypothetical protein
VHIHLCAIHHTGSMLSALHNTREQIRDAIQLD